MKVKMKAARTGRRAELQLTVMRPGPGQTRRRIWAVLGTVAAGATNSKLLLSGGTALISLAAYGAAFGWPFAAGFVALLFAHEMGHVIALRREGIAASPPMFIPFLGAVIGARSLGDNALAEARVGLAGPVLGTAAAGAVAIAAALTGSHLLAVLAYSGFVINMFNLLPVVPLDGGRAMAAVSPWMRLLGLAALVGLLIIAHTLVLLAVVALSELELRARVRRADPRRQDYYRVSGRSRLAVGTVYVALLAALAVGLSFTYGAVGHAH